MLPENFRASRERFLELARRAGFHTASFPHAEAGGSHLSTDVACHAPQPGKPVIYLSSGTHGIEAYAGAACQFRFMERHAERFAGAGLGFVLIHAVNPWGFDQDRRVTVEGVDLNRNFIDFEAGLPASDYAAFHAMLVERFRPLPAGWRNELRLMSGALTRAKRLRMQAAITRGQHTHPDGLFYGGKAATESRRIWETIIRTYRYGDAPVVLLDIHTGLGKPGHGELLSYLPADDPRFIEMNRWLHGELRSIAEDKAVSAAVAGTLTEGFDRLAVGESHAIGLEFGTRPALPVLNALRLDHWVAAYAGEAAGAWRTPARRAMRRAFRPDDARWLEVVLRRFDEVAGCLHQGMLGKRRPGDA
ncbi:DUF2817 domain-containing protein [Noviherbaspirillum galbum]|uniref:DUF2817 domain-containing protein n=1 Tax=Noviherbaspirillum galbum TaxID=2709383 RepID=A0A6B3SXS7_9BURK|nr:DUF2817 domain-containing protein [Noviherbaspirillum galbum]NEX63986.1 DUF2817 domain-containing protein [Noviherbaspirillum galbum]